MGNPRVMIVDDSAENLRLLENMLTARGYGVLALPSGAMALRAAKKAPPDIILLDINMPDMDGYEVCRHIKENQELSEIPIIFISALDSQSNKIDAFKAGGVDYITKPFNMEEADARIGNHLKIAYLKQQLAANNQLLEEKVAKRTAELAGINNRLRSIETLKSDFLNMICYEMRTPITGMSKLLETAFELLADSDQLSQLYDLYRQSRSRIDDLLDDAMILTSLEEGCFEMNPTFDSIKALVKKIVHKYRIELTCEFNMKEDMSRQPRYDWLEKAVDTFVMVAACFSSRDRIRMSFSQKRDNAHICFYMDNMNLDRNKAKSFFDIMSTVRSSSYAENLGLAPVVAERIITLYGGKVNLFHKDNRSGSLDVEIPVATK